ncbi:VOC family protein [Streptococcus dysgalactiae]|uniref:Bleomycin resistance protein n=1 Tax=Streptococcus dysgalactiae subsp. equisimilis TaxID=119602 RepID=A0A9X8SXW9_STREQ|nr:VOC family protein [Streptococcus dysgalactiae]SQF66428.1 bleomycin resistance protein [Streptococcus dysgalactiae subsp. equisimilis]VEF04262.1 bleomycin resistance protein [Streptococcus dysgalactiae subsp. equisimilis]
MVTAINVYLVTDGNGQEAVAFYQEVFQAKVVNLFLWKDGVPDCPKTHEHLVLNAQLDIDGIRLDLSDENPDVGYQTGVNMTASIMVDSIEEAQRIYDKLITNAKAINLPFQKTFWSPAYANITDQFGMMWQLNTELKAEH